MSPELDADARHRATRSLAYVAQEFPSILARVAEMPLFSYGFSRGDGACTHPPLLHDSWLLCWGARPFVRAPLPDGFTALATRNGGGSEYVVVMWHRNGRRFWFHDQYVNFHGGDASQERTRQRLAAALARWDSGLRDVLQCGDSDNESIDPIMRVR